MCFQWLVYFLMSLLAFVVLIIFLVTHIYTFIMVGLSILYLTGLPMKTFVIAELRFLQATCLQVPKQWCQS